MTNKISDKPSSLDWVGCVPGVGTAVGFVEMVYNFALLVIAEFSRGLDPNKAQQKKEDVITFNQLGATQQATKISLIRPDTAAAKKLLGEAEAMCHAAELLHLKSKQSSEEHEKKTDLIAKKCFTAMLRMTWIGGIGICVYKLLKKPPLTPSS